MTTTREQILEIIISDNKYILAESIKFYTGYHRFIILFFIVVIIFINKDNKRISSESIKVYDGYSSLRKRLFR